MCFDSPNRRPSPPRRALVAGLAMTLVAALGLATAGCGNKKPPTPPPRMVAAATVDLAVAQRGSELQFAFAYPSVTIGGLPLPGLEAVELWRMVRPLSPPAPEEAEGEEESTEEPEAEAAEPPVEEEPPPPPSTFLFQRPTTAAEVKAEDRVQVDPREFLALAEMVLRIEGPELQAAISGDRVLLRLPIGELPPPEVPEDERELEIFGVMTVAAPKSLSSEISNLVKILPRTPPEPPSQIETRPGADGINVAWQADDPPVGFRVYRRDAASRAYGVPIAEPAPEARSHLDATATFDSSYVYTVTTVSLETPLVESALAGEREVKHEDRYPPAAPRGLLVLAEAGRVRLLWEPSADDDLAGYLVYRRGDDGSGFDQLTGEPGLALEYLDQAVGSGRGYSYYVSAVDRSGNESEASKTVDVEVP